MNNGMHQFVSPSACWERSPVVSFARHCSVSCMHALQANFDVRQAHCQLRMPKFYCEWRA
eukprot:4045388-Amphidinium_carterae.1